MDTRAPVEFDRGAFPGTVNLPLMTDGEREQVGTCYKQKGRGAAVQLGHTLVSGETKSSRIEAWCDFAKHNPEGYLYCFRGGMRSEITQRWMREAGVDYPRIVGGYKAMRGFLVEELERLSGLGEFVLIAGRTGTGKTRVVEHLPRAVDLEGLANHRGSSFGRLPGGQPGQVDFENTLAIQLMKLFEQSDVPVVMEDEGKLVGRVALPPALVSKMRESPLMVVEAELEDRVDVIFDDYIDNLSERYRQLAGIQGDELHRQHLVDSLDRIRKRLGSEKHKEISDVMERAFRAPEADAPGLHRDWIRALLVDYYDPMYDYLVNRRVGPVIARGDRAVIIEAASSLSAT